MTLSASRWQRFLVSFLLLLGASVIHGFVSVSPPAKATVVCSACPLAGQVSAPSEAENKALVGTKKPVQLPLSSGLRFLQESFRGQAHRYLLKLMRRHGDNYMLWNKYVVLHDAAAIRDVLETHNLEKTPEVKRGYKFMFQGNGGILSAPWKDWMQQRRMAAPALNEAVIGKLLPKFKHGSMPFFDYIESAVVAGEPVEMNQAFTAVAMDIIGLVVLGRTLDETERLSSSTKTLRTSFPAAIAVLSKEAVRQMVLPGQNSPIPKPSKKVRRAQRVADEFLEDCIRIRLQERADGSTIKTDLLNILLDAESKGTISREGVKGQLLTFIFAGHDTTAHTLTWLLWEVSLQPELQEELAAEAKAVLPDRTDFPLSQEIIAKKLPLLDRVWKEANRKHPAAATGTLRTVGDSPIVVGDGLELPPNASVMIPPYSLHRNERYWPDPEVFDPSRFLPEHEASRDPMTFQAFSGGPRNCIGSRLARAEALSLLAPLFRRYKFQCLSGDSEPADYHSLTRKPRDGISFTITARQD